MKKVLFSILLCLLLAACADPASPDNLEPTLTMLPASDVSRTEATLTARVDYRGTEPLSRLTFHWGNESRDLDNPTVTNPTLKLTGLRPGMTYTCYIEGATATARLRSDTIQFTTIPNQRPSVSSARPLSTGPVGIIVAFEVTDDGGEPLTSAGCEVVALPVGEVVRVRVADANPSKGIQTLRLTGLQPETLYRITPFASNTAGESLGEPLEYTTGNSVNLVEAGELPALFDGLKRLPLEKLTISGNINGTDVKFLRMLTGAPVESSIESSVTVLDLTDSRIVEGGESYDNSHYTATNEVTTDLLADCRRLKAVSLPSTATRLYRNAFARCESLERLTIGADVAELLPSDGCRSLAVIDVSAANAHYASIDGVLYNRDVTEILWLPLGKSGEYVIPSSVTAIGEAAFRESAITRLVIPESVKTIGRGAFSLSSLQEITLPGTLTNISAGMFQGCASLHTLRLGRGVEYIEDYAFGGTSLVNLYIGATIPPAVSTNAMAGFTPANCVLYVPAGRKTIYRNHATWGKFSSVKEF